MDNLNCKMQTHARMCRENIELEEKKTPIETILQLKVRVWRIICRKSGEAYQDDILKGDSP